MFIEHKNIFSFYLIITCFINIVKSNSKHDGLNTKLNDSFNNNNNNSIDIHSFKHCDDLPIVDKTNLDDAPIMIIVQVIAFVLIHIIGTIGNLIVVYVILINRKLKTATNMYLLNLAIADLIYLQGIPFYITTLIKQQWIFKLVLCKLYWILTGINQFTSIFILTVLAFDRYLAVCHPVLAINWRKLISAEIILGVIWVISVVVMMPVILYSDVDLVLFELEPDLLLNFTNDAVNVLGMQVTNDSSFANRSSLKCIKPTCTIKWPENSIIKTDMAFVTYGAILSFLVPITLITIFYFSVIMRLRSNKSRLNNQSTERQRARRKVTTLVLSVISLYIVTYAPFWILQVCLITYYIINNHPSENFHKITMYLSSVCQILLYLNSALNPYLYAFLSEVFRDSFRKVIQCYYNPIVLLKPNVNDNATCDLKTKIPKANVANEPNAKCHSVFHSSIKKGVLNKNNDGIIPGNGEQERFLFCDISDIDDKNSRTFMSKRTSNSHLSVNEKNGLIELDNLDFSNEKKTQTKSNENFNKKTFPTLNNDNEAKTTNLKSAIFKDKKNTLSVLPNIASVSDHSHISHVYANNTVTPRVD